jgi:hypothetical protein
VKQADQTNHDEGELHKVEQRHLHRAIPNANLLAQGDA